MPGYLNDVWLKSADLWEWSEYPEANVLEDLHMLRDIGYASVIATVSLMGAAQAASPQGSADDLRGTVSQAAGIEAISAENDVVRIGWSRDDVEVTVDGTPLKPAAGLGSWAAFKSVGDKAIVMGDTVVFEDEITPAIDAALESGLNVTALHNHFIFDEPPVYFMHIGGEGEAATLANGVNAIWSAIRDVRAAHAQPRRSFNKGQPTLAGGEAIEAAPLEEILGAAPSTAGDVLKFTFPHAARAHGAQIGGPMGVSTWAAFSGSTRSATVDGDFVMEEHQVQPTLRALRSQDLHVVALHNHMIGEHPRLYFLHYWGRGEAPALANAVRHAMDVQLAARNGR